MRVMLKVNMPVEEGDKLAKAGKLEETIMGILAEQKPEAVYFVANNGMRTAILFIIINDSSEITKYCEPWFLATNVFIEMTPVMPPDDLEKGAPAIIAAAKKYG